MRMAKAFGGPAERNAVGQRRMEFFFKEKQRKKLQNGEIRSIDFPASIVTIFLRGLAALVYEPCCIWSLSFALFTGFSPSGRSDECKLWEASIYMGPLSFFSLYNGLLFIAWSVHFHIAFALFQVSTQRTVFFILRRCIASFLVCFTRPAVFTNPSCTIKRRKKTKKRIWNVTAREAFRHGILLEFTFFFITVQHCCFFRMQILGNG